MQLKDVLKYELIGLEIEIKKSHNPTLVGMKGRIVEETRNMIKIQTKNKEKTIIKDQITFTTNIRNKKIEINGKLLVGRPEDRLKKKTKL